MIQKLMHKLWEAESFVFVCFWLLEPMIRIFGVAKRVIRPFEEFVKEGYVVADLGCSRGYFTLPLAELVGPEGKVYAVDLNRKCIRALGKKVEKGGYRNIESHASSAADLSFIEDSSVDFVLASGLLCSMPHDRQLFVSEMKRILKPTAHAYISLGAGPPFGFMDREEWEKMLKGFRVEQEGSWQKGWALVSLKQDTAV
jgi:ubiquinone/menaquinone biosynthesis C-methylase UbiE